MPAWRNLPSALSTKAVHRQTHATDILFDVFHIVHPFKALFSLNARIFVMQLKAKFNSRRF